jgi:hypothetical protein
VVLTRTVTPVPILLSKSSVLMYVPEENLSFVVVADIFTIGADEISTHLTTVEPAAVEVPLAYKKNVDPLPEEVANAPLSILNEL